MKKDNILPFESGTRRAGKSDDGGNGGDMDTLIKRVEQLEKDTNQIRVDMATLTTRSETFATKEDMQLIRTDMHKEISAQTKWIATTIIGVAALCMTAAKFLF